MDALVLWWHSALEAKAQGLPSRPSSPSPSDLEGLKDDDATSMDGSISASPPVKSTVQQPSARPTSSSWVRWWRRDQSYRGDTASNRPQLRESNSEPPSNVVSAAPLFQRYYTDIYLSQCPTLLELLIPNQLPACIFRLPTSKTAMSRQISRRARNSPKRCGLPPTSL